MSLALASELVMAYGWNSTSCQILNPGIDHWFSDNARAVVGYTRRHSLLVVAGAPVCALPVLAEICAEFEAFAAARRCRVCYVCAEERLHSLFAASPNHAAIAIGAQPVWNPQSWRQTVRERASLRAQLNRARNKGVVIEAVVPADAAASPELRQVLGEWLDARQLPPLHFLVEPNVLDGVVHDRVVIAARREGRVVAFLVASPIVARHGYLVELVARSPRAPNGTSELLIDAAMQRFASDDCHFATLGLVALAQAAKAEIRRNPWWLRPLMQFARLHANRFYNFEGLEQFRVKMSPLAWETIYAISNEPQFSIPTLYSIGAAFSGIPPWQALAIGIMKAIRHEFRTYYKSTRSRTRDSIAGSRG
jgi:phosphatidylglycerol lysyltransferase